jgi:hypothetical protein
MDMGIFAGIPDSFSFSRGRRGDRNELTRGKQIRINKIGALWLTDFGFITRGGMGIWKKGNYP